MLFVLRNSWGLLFGLGLLLIGNGMQATVLGPRGAIEGFNTSQMSVVMSAYFAGFLIGARLIPLLIRRVGHVRVFAALGSLVTFTLLAYPMFPYLWVWILLRVMLGLCFSGIYTSVESWLNATATNETRGQALALYLMVIMLGIVVAQWLVSLGDPAGYELFIIPAMLVALAIAPMLLAVSLAPPFAETKPLSLRSLYRASPLGVVGIFLIGGVYGAQFGMVSVWATVAGLSVRDLAIFTSAIYVGGLVAQYPLGWLSDRMDRRKLFIWQALVGGVVLALPMFLALPFWMLTGVAAVCGAVCNPLYTQLQSYVNDRMEGNDMAATSAGLLFVNGLGALFGPIVTGWMMDGIGPDGFFLFIAVLYFAIAAYTQWRILRRPQK